MNGLAWMLLAFPVLTLRPLGAAPLRQQAGEEREVRVLAVQGDSVQIDAGAEGGVREGDRVRLRPRGSAERFGRVQSVAETTAWVVLFPEAREGSRVEVGTAGVVSVAAQRSEEEQDGFRERSGPLPLEPPRWRPGAGAGSKAEPLLAQLGTRPEERPSRWDGAWWLQARTIWQRRFRDSRSSFARAGLRLHGENPFGRGGALDFRAEADLRDWSAAGEPGDTERALRLERLAWRVGGDRHRPHRWEVGRFVQQAAPGLGLLDGVAWEYGRSDGPRVGASAGWLPEGTQDLSTGRDFQLAAHVRGQWGGTGLRAEQWRAGAALQQTWHRGEQDRRLLLLNVDWMRDRFAWRNAAWVDVYDDDPGKDDGAELTLAHSLLHWNGDAAGWSTGLRHWRFPSLQRFQAGRFTPLELFDGRTTRADVAIWRDLTPDWRLRVSADHWESEDGDGSGGEVRSDWRGLFDADLRAGLAVFAHEGAFTDVVGARASQELGSLRGRWRLEAESARYATRAADQTSRERRVRLAWSWTGATGWSLHADLGWRWGDETDSPELGFFLQRRF